MDREVVVAPKDGTPEAEAGESFCLFILAEPAQHVADWNAIETVRDE